MKHILILFIILSSTFTWAVPSLSEMLDIDRFEAYTEAWSQTMHKREKTAIAKAVSRLTPKDIYGMKFDSKQLGDASEYDNLIFKYLKEKHPELNVKKTDVDWGYNFFKNKLQAAYIEKKPRVKVLKTEKNLIKDNNNGLKSALPQEADQVLLSVDGYSSNRTTRAIFWDASANNRKVELHVGSAGDFIDNMQKRGMEIVSEVKTMANNYNPIYLVKEPGADTYHYAITQISGNDRVKHLSMQSSLVRWQYKNGKLANPPPRKVIGDATQLLLKEEKALTQVLKVLPKADQVVIGQKGAFQRTFGSMGKADSILKVMNKDLNALNKVLTDKELRLVKKLYANPETITTSVMKHASDWDKIYEKAQPTLKKNSIPLAVSPQRFNLDKGSYEFSDYVLKNRKGEDVRFRVFSNSWGDEVLPIARALKKSGYKNISYIGTAGVMPGSDIKLGDLVMPDGAYDGNDIRRSLRPSLVPEGIKRAESVVTVQSPFEETIDWLKRQKDRAQVVEVETGHLSSVFNQPDERVTTMLLISDEVGVEGKSLAEASSSARRNSQIKAISSIIDSSDIIAPTRTFTKSNNLMESVNEILGSKDEVYKFNIHRQAMLSGVEDPSNFNKIIKSLSNKTPSFTTGSVEKKLSSSSKQLLNYLEELDKSGLIGKLGIGADFLDGIWSPKQAVKLNLEFISNESLEEARRIYGELSKIDKNFAKNFKISFTTDSTPDGFIRLARLPKGDEILLELYKDSALGFGGLASTETRSGKLKFVKVSDPLSGKAVASTAFFEPDNNTKKVLKLAQTKNLNKELFLTEIKDIHLDTPSIKFSVEEVKHLPEGALAQFVPEYTKKGVLDIKLKITPEGFNNPLVLVEEYAHALQIAGPSYSSWASNAGEFKLHSVQSPFHWAETVANANAGSTESIRRLAAMELEAALVAEKIYYDNPDLYGTKDDLQPNLVKDFQDSRSAHAEKLYKEATKANRADLKIRKQQWNKQREAFAALEKKKDKLDTLVGRNDRKGVRKLLEAYLPWPLMEPTEKIVWKDWLDAIEKPNLNKRKLIYRGLEGDYIFRNAKNEPFLMSTVMTRNQGSYNRRLRSLKTLRDKFGTNILDADPADVINFKGYKQTPSLTTQMWNHSDEPLGSPFISASKIDTANDFGDEKMVAILIDEKRLMLNSQALGYLEEQERLIPLLVFPDEIIHHEINTNKSIDVEEFKEKVKKKIGAKKFKSIGPINFKGEDDFAQKSLIDSHKRFLDPKALRAVSSETSSFKSKSLKSSPSCSVGKSNMACNCVFKTLSALLNEP